MGMAAAVHFVDSRLLKWVQQAAETIVMNWYAYHRLLKLMQVPKLGSELDKLVVAYRLISRP